MSTRASHESHQAHEATCEEEAVAVARDSARPEIKAAAIADLLTGDQPAIVAERYQLKAATVRSWKARLDGTRATPVATEGRGVATGVATVMQRPALLAQQQTIGDMIMENLRARLLATQRIAEYATTTSWLNNQNAADLATLLEALDRSTIGILDRLARASGTNDAGG